jgi:hypothetical protein
MVSPMRRRVFAVAIATLLGLAGLAGCGDAPAPRVPVCADLQIGRAAPRAQCGATLDFTPINRYQGAIASVQDREGAVVLIDGNCTGTLIAAAAGPVVLTAGHCVGLGDQALLAFNVEAEPDGEQLVTNGTVIEQSTAPDYALIALDQLPAIAPTLLTSQSTELLAIIQHPRGGLKVIAEGAFLAGCDGQLFYGDLDTLVGSSGAGVLNRQGYLLGVHSDGDCAEDGTGSNSGWSAASIIDASAYLQPDDLADR